MTTAEALTAAKNRLNISTTDFDTQLTDFFDAAVDRLSPKVRKEIAPQTTAATVDSFGECFVELSTLTTPVADVRYVEATTGEQWFPADKIYRHGTQLRIRDLNSFVTQLRIYGLKNYVVASAAVDIPEVYELPVVWYMMAEFYDLLAGSKSKFNIYMQTNGGNAVDDMRSEAEYYENKATAYIDDRAELQGTQ